MADKLVPGDSLNEEVFNKFNGMADEVNALKESGGGGSTVSVTQTLTSGTKIGAITVDGKTTALYAPENSGGSGGGGGSVPADAIIDVGVLPTENINENAIYRVNTAELGVMAGGAYIPNGMEIDGMIMTIVVFDTLPDISELTPCGSTFYIQSSDNTAWVYPDIDGGLVNIADMMGDMWGGIVSSKYQAIDTEKQYIVYSKGEIKLYHYKSGWHEIGFGGDAIIDCEQVLPPVGNEKAIYRVTPIANLGFMMSGMYVANGDSIQGATLNIIPVATLPEVGKPIEDPSTMAMNSYLQISDGRAYGYSPDGGWFDLAGSLLNGGVVGSIAEATDPDLVYLVAEPITPHIVYNGEFDTLLGISATVQAVDILPEEGAIVIDVPNNRYNFYYQRSDGGVYGYVTTHLVGIDADGWMPMNELITHFSWSFSYGGVSPTLNSCTVENTVYLLWNEPIPKLYQYTPNGYSEIVEIKNKKFGFDRSKTGDDPFEDVGDYRYVTLSGKTKTACMELLSYVKANYSKITSIQYRNELGGISTICPVICNMDYGINATPRPSQLVVRGYYGGVDADSSEFRFGLRNDGVLIYPKENNMWGLVLLLMFSITVTTA